MNLLDIIMREICAEMDWADRKEPGFYTGRIRARLTPVAEAAQAVIEAADKVASDWCGDSVRLGKKIDNLIEALAALEEASDGTDEAD